MPCELTADVTISSSLDFLYGLQQQPPVQHARKAYAERCDTHGLGPCSTRQPSEFTRAPATGSQVPQRALLLLHHVAGGLVAVQEGAVL